MCDKNLLLVSSIEKFPCLYNHNLQDYMKKDLTEKAWNEVAAQVQFTVAECKEKWRNLRYSLLRSLKPNAYGTYKKKYYLHKEMEFLIPFMKPSSKPPLFATQSEDDIDEESGHELNHDVTSPQQQLFEYEFLNTEPTSKRKRIEQFQSHFQAMENADLADTRRQFMLGLMPEINALSDDQMKVFRRKVLTLLDEITEEGLGLEDGVNIQGDSYKNQRIKPEPTDELRHTVFTVN